MLPTLVLLVGLSVPAAADKPPEVRTVLDDALKALGGRDKLAKLPATTFNSEGFLLVGGIGRVTSKSSWSVQYPDKYRYDAKIMITADESDLLAVGNGKTGWTKSAGGAANAMNANELAMLQQDARAVHLAHLLYPLTEKEYELKPLGELKIAERPAVGIKVVQKGQPDLDLFFDKETHLPVKVSFLCKEHADYDAVPHAFVFSGYKEADGVNHFTKIELYRKEEKVLEMNLSNVKRAAKVDASLFEKP